MQPSALFKPTLLAAGIVAALGFDLQPVEAGYIQSNLVSDISGLAVISDPALKNSWGISHSPTSPFWVSDQGTNLTTLYVVNSSGVSKNLMLPQVSIPTTASGPQGPTGQVSNIGGTNFVINGQPSRFIFADLNGTISAWNQTLGTTAAIKATTPNSVYTGLAISSGKDKLYAANTAGVGSIDVFNASFAPISLGGNAFQNPFPGLSRSTSRRSAARYM